MTPGLVVKLRPTTPWRTGSESGARERVEPAYHSDSVYSAVTAALRALGLGDEWFDATARCHERPAVAFSSAFPFLNDTRFVVPPKTLWPPAPSSRIRWKSARFVPIPVVESLLKRRMPDDDRWAIDGTSGCLVPPGTRGPFRPAVRSRAAVDRLNGGIDLHAKACLEFAPGAGLWIAAAFAGEQEKQRWMGPIQAAFRLLADCGFGGARSSGWGRAETPEFAEGDLPVMIASLDALKPPERGAAPPENEPEMPALPESAYWLLSLFTPAAADEVDWTRGVYRLLPRGGRVESLAGWGQPKKSLNMIEEGSVLLAGSPLRGSAPDVAPDGFAHPVYRAGFAFSIPIPWHAPANHRAKPAAVPQIATEPRPLGSGSEIESPPGAPAEPQPMTEPAPVEEPGPEPQASESGSEVESPPGAPAEPQPMTEPAPVEESGPEPRPSGSGSEIQTSPGAAVEPPVAEDLPGIPQPLPPVAVQPPEAPAEPPEPPVEPPPVEEPGPEPAPLTEPPAEPPQPNPDETPADGEPGKEAQ